MQQYLAFELANDVVWRRTDFVETILGRPPLQLRQRIREHRTLLTAQNPATAPLTPPPVDREDRTS